MKKLLITLEYPPQVGGVANYLADICDSQLEDLIVLASKLILPQGGRVPEGQERGVIYRRQFFIKWLWPHWLPLLFIVKKIIKREKIEKIEVGQILPIGTVALYFKKRFNIPYRLYTYGMDVTFAQRKPKLLKKILDNAEEIITISNFTKQKLLEAGADESKIKIIEPQAHITPEKFKVSEKEIEEFKNKYKLNGKKIILTVGRLVSRKGQGTVIQCLPKISGAIYLIVGKGEDRSRLKQLARDNRVEDRIIFTGELTDREIAICYTICDVFVMLTREEGDDFEGYGIVYKEAQSFGKPIVAGRAGGASEAIGNNGVLVDSNNQEEIVEAIIDCLK